MSRPLRFALLGTGFWAPYQFAAWKEVGGVECVAVYNRTVSRAYEFVQAAGLHATVYQEVRELLKREELDFVDIVTSAETHLQFVRLAAEHGLPVICQKPMATSYADALEMVSICNEAGVPFYVHENWRWQAPIRALKKYLAEGLIGQPFRSRLRMVSGFPVFENQPSLRHIEKFLLLDMGSHLLDVARFLFGEPDSVYCATQTVQPDVRGEDVATVVLHLPGNNIVICELGYAGTPLEVDRFPQTFALVEGDNGSIEIAPDYWVHVTTTAGTKLIHAAPPSFAWADPAYEIVHASIVPCHIDLLRGLRGERLPETTGSDNLRTMRLVFEAYESAKCNRTIALDNKSLRVDPGAFESPHYRSTAEQF